MTRTVRATIWFTAMIVAAAVHPVVGTTIQSTQAQSQTAASPIASQPAKDGGSDLEMKKYLLEVKKANIEEKKAADARSATKWTALAIFVPLILGFASLYWQARTAIKLQALQSADAFQLKAAEAVMDSKSTKAGEEHAIALRTLFPRRIPDGFVAAFKTENDLRRMLEHAAGHREDILEGRFVINTRHAGRSWEVIVEPDEIRQLLVVLTAYPLDQAAS